MACACKMAKESKRKEYSFKSLNDGEKNIALVLLSWLKDTIIGFIWRVLLAVFVLVVGSVATIVILLSIVVFGKTKIRIPEKLIDIFKAF